ncbi:hypothetical protein E8L90_16920 [Brevibacillus antibioticus]|uniref:DUF4352 domain-containing protein n=1 Tax=Brevibacillus antibioticus TaxID=2570228 RepID=A0A4U2YC88_9BACL|nr:hypothetical protein [Brevibacillus antibioticus]TKI57011.1 hypothetical protein E8L90_16920 [Brevibacillus antibioticus]
MKKAIKGTIATALLLSSLSIWAGVMASNDSAETSHVISKVESSKAGAFEPHGKRPGIKNGTLPTDEKNVSYGFSVPNGFAYGKVWIKNNGKAKLTFTVKNTHFDDIVMSGSVKKGESKSFYVDPNEGWGADNHLIAFSSDENLDGTFSVMCFDNDKFE